MQSLHEINLVLPDQSATEKVAVALANAISSSSVIALNGPLGAGKTKFVQFFAGALGVEEVVNSPTFTMLNEYHSGRLPLYHMDLYRLSEPGTGGALEFLEAELAELRAHAHVLLIEWAELLQKYSRAEGNFLIQLDHLVATFEYGSYDEVINENPINSTSSLYRELTGRRIRIAATGPHSEEILRQASGPIAEFLHN